MRDELGENTQTKKPGQGNMRRNGVIGIVALLIAAGGYILLNRGGDTISSGTTFVAKRGNLDITVVEGGNVKAMESQEIRSQIRGRSGVKILSIIEEGYRVTADDVEAGLILVELDASELEDRLVNEQISFETAKSNYIDKQAQYEIQINQNQSDMTSAELDAKFALMDFQKFLGERAVGVIVKNLKLDQKARELALLKAQGGIRSTIPEPDTAPAPVKVDPQGEGRDWESGDTARRSGGQRSPRGSRPEGAARREGRPSGFDGSGGGHPGGFGGPPQGGQMDPERFLEMIEANGGELPQAMADRMREMGMDPDEIIRQVRGQASNKPGTPEIQLEIKTETKAPTTFLIDPEYIEARKALNFSTYANEEELEDGEARQQIRQFSGNVVKATEDLQIFTTDLEGKSRLAERDFITQNELEREKLKVNKAKIDKGLAETALSLYIRYTLPKEAEQLLSDYEEALMNLERTMQEVGAKLSQAEVGLHSAEGKYNLQSEEVADIEEQITLTTIRAERTGLVVYGSSGEGNPWRRSSEEPIQEGTTLRQRQKIITIPDMTKMGVTVNIHEAAVQKIAKGQTVSITIDAFRERELQGMVERVAVLADSANMFMNPDLKVYPTVVRIDGVHDWLRPGMSAQVTILVDQLHDVVYIPIQAVSYRGDDQVCYVVNGSGGTERRVITTGSFTEEFIEIQSGLEEGEEVLLLAPNTGEQDDLDQDTVPEETNPVEAAA